MSIFGPASSVTAADIAQLEEGIQFFQSSAANQTAVAGSIVAGTTTVAAYAAQLLDTNLSFSQVAMGVSCLMLGTAQPIATLDNISTNFLPDQVTHALAFGFEPTVYAAEATGLALAGEAGFQSFVALDATQFSQAVATATGVNQAAIQQFVINWTNFYTANPGATFGLTVQQAAYGAAFGDAVGVALLNPTSADLQTVITTTPDGLLIEGDVANHLLDIATGQYVEGVPCDTLPQHQALQGEVGNFEGGLTLTVGINSPTQGFQTGTGGSFSNLATGGVFNAGPGGNPPLGTTNTLNAGDNLQGSQDGTSILELNTIDSSFFGANDPFALSVTMNNVGTANILNNADDLAGFAGNITGLTTVSILAGSNPTGDVQLGQAGQGLNTALETININAGEFTPGTPANGFNSVAGSDLNVFIQSSALSGTTDNLDVNLFGVGTTVDVNVTGGTNTYETINVSSGGTGPNHIDLDAVVPTVTVLGDQNLEICGDALNQDTLTTFDSIASVAGQAITAFFEGPNPGDVTANGGAGDENFTFLTFDDASGETTFTDTDAVDGGAGDNRLTLQAFEGALLGAGVGPNIVNIDTIVHTTFVNDCFDDCNYGSMDGDLTVDMANSGSATNLELQGHYDFDVTVSNLTSADTVIYSGFHLETLTLEHVSLNGIFNLTLAQDECVGEAFGPQDHVLDDLVVDGLLVNIDSLGVSDANEITGAGDINANLTITGDTDLTIGSKADPYDFDGGSVDASAFTADLTIFLGDATISVTGGLGNDTIDVVVNDTGQPKLIDLSVGGNDTVVFEDEQTVDNVAITSANYTTITGFTLLGDAANTDTIAIDVAAPTQIDLDQTNGGAVNPGDAVSFYGLTFGQPNDNLAGQAINFISIQANNNSTGFSLQGYFDFLMDGTLIGVNPACDNLLMSMYDNLTGSAVLIEAHPGNAVLNAGDDVDMVGLIQMSFTDYLSFGPTGLEFVQFP